MIEFLKNWLLSIVVMVIFMSLVDMILPSDTFKKYAKLVIGLIVIATIMIPIVKLFDRGTDVEAFVSKYVEDFNKNPESFNREEVQKNFQTQTIEVYKEEIVKKIENEILRSTGKKYKVARFEMVEDSNRMDFTDVTYIELKPSGDTTVKPVDKVDIGKTVTPADAPRDGKVENLLKDKFNINPSVVKFVK